MKADTTAKLPTTTSTMDTERPGIVMSSVVVAARCEYIGDNEYGQPKWRIDLPGKILSLQEMELLEKLFPHTHIGVNRLLAVESLLSVIE